MAAAPRDLDGEFIDRRHDRAGGGKDAPRLLARRIVQRIDLGDVEAVHDPFLDHHPRTAPILLGGLKDQRNPATKAARLGQVFRRPQKHRRMPVMAASMHLARRLRGIIDPCFLEDRQRVHIGAQSHDRPRALAIDDRHDPTLRDARVDLIHPDFRKPRGHESRRFMAIKGQLGMGMKMPAPCGHLGREPCNTIDDRHGWTPWFGLGLTQS